MINKYSTHTVFKIAIILVHWYHQHTSYAHAMYYFLLKHLTQTKVVFV